MGKILARISRKKKNLPLTADEWLVLAHHTLMKEYGWISLDEFKSLSAQMVNNLIMEINKDREREEKEMNKGRGKK